MTPPKTVLDASALLAFLFDEPGVEAVTAALAETCAISAVNFAEALSKLSDHGQDVDQAAERMASQGLTGSALMVVPVEESQAREIARLRKQTRGTGLSLGDRACLALARSLKLPVLTADRAWLALDLKVDVRAVR